MTSDLRWCVIFPNCSSSSERRCAIEFALMNMVLFLRKKIATKHFVLNVADKAESVRFPRLSPFMVITWYFLSFAQRQDLLFMKFSTAPLCGWFF